MKLFLKLAILANVEIWRLPLPPPCLTTSANKEIYSDYSSVNCIVYISIYKSFRQALLKISRRRSDPTSDYVLSNSTMYPDYVQDYDEFLKTSRSPSLIEIPVVSLNFLK